MISGLVREKKGLRAAEGEGDAEEVEEVTQLDQFLIGLAKGLSAGGDTLGECYELMVKDAGEVLMVIDLATRILNNQADPAMSAVVMVKFYGLVKATLRECRISELLTHLFDFSSIANNAVEHKEELAGVFTTLSISFMTHKYEQIGRILGITIKQLLDFYVL